MKDFIIDLKLLEEGVSDEDYFDLSNYIKSLSEKINHLNHSSMIGIVAEYGKGKSTLIRQIEKSRKDKKETWVQFDAWKVPERKELWETFVIDLARQINKEAFENALKELDGKQDEDKKLGINTVVDIAKFLSAGVVDLSFVKNLNHFYNNSPARRVFEIQEVLKDIIKQFKGDKLIIVVEDVDRSGEQGIFFIETLKQFIRDNEEDLDKKIIVILPIAETSFLKNEESYLKSLDIIEFLEHKEKKYENFLKKIIKEELINEKILKQISDFFILLSREYPNTTMRKIKLILRKANISYKMLEGEGYKPEWRVCIAVEACRFFKDHSIKNKDVSLLDSYVFENHIPENSILGRFLYTISEQGQNTDLIRNSTTEEKVFESAPLPWKFHSGVSSSIPSKPYFPSHSIGFRDEESRGILLDFYLRH